MTRTLFCLTAGVFLFPFTGIKAASSVNANLLWQQYTGIKIQTPEKKPVKYGASVPVSFEATKKNGKTRRIRSNTSKFKITVEGGTLKGGYVQVVSMPEEQNLRAVKIRIRDKGLFGKRLEDSLILPIDFKTALNLRFSGENGEDGKKGQGHFGKPVFGRDGNHGGYGQDGKNATHGKDLLIRVSSEHDPLSAEEIYLLEVNDAKGKKKYYFRWMINDGGINIEAKGGNGGRGGDGGRGGNGKDGKYDPEKNKTKEAGAGGDGGDGGNGGDAGNGGNIDLQVDEESIRVIEYIKVQNEAGYRGSGGDGHGHAGKAGDALEGQFQPRDGQAGQEGASGSPGQDGYYRVRVLKI